MSGYVTPAKLALLNGVVKQNRTQALQEYAVMNRALAAGMYEVTLDHAFETADIYPAFTPNWNTIALWRRYIGSGFSHYGNAYAQRQRCHGAVFLYAVLGRACLRIGQGGQLDYAWVLEHIGIGADCSLRQVRQR